VISGISNLAVFKSALQRYNRVPGTIKGQVATKAKKAIKSFAFLPIFKNPYLGVKDSARIGRADFRDGVLEVGEEELALSRHGDSPFLTKNCHTLGMASDRFQKHHGIIGWLALVGLPIH
jgi:hypothetical protein